MAPPQKAEFSVKVVEPVRLAQQDVHDPPTRARRGTKDGMVRMGRQLRSGLGLCSRRERRESEEQIFRGVHTYEEETTASTADVGEQSKQSTTLRGRTRIVCMYYVCMFRLVSFLATLEK